MSHELVIADAWLIATLSGDTQLTEIATGVFRGRAPVGTLPIYVIFAAQSGGNDSQTLQAHRLLSNPLFQVTAVGPASNTQGVANVAARIDALLCPNHGAGSGATADGLISACWREQPLQMDEEALVSGEQWTRIGGLYRLQIQSIS